MLAEFDPETNFTLFRPLLARPVPVPDGVEKGVVACIRPNEDLLEAVEEACRKHGVSQGIIRSGVGSIVGAEFDDGRRVEEVPTEIVVLNGRISPDPSGLGRAEIKIALIDASGTIHHGRLARGCNPVLICFELVLETASSPPPGIPIS